ncbi:hypothetical protein [Clostridium sp. D33t1_170424_F3]|nr:hypothetical protein [Clostridium sp. D33t1_170424_F3]
MKQIHTNKEWRLGCHLCEYNCAFANPGNDGGVKKPVDEAV